MTTQEVAATEQDVARAIEAARTAPDGASRLAALAPENAAAYRGRTSAEVSRLRGWLLAAFADTGLPEMTLPVVLETLEVGHTPYEVAGAAIAVRGYDGPADGVLPSLLRALRNMSGRDSTVSFERYDPRWPFLAPTSATTEVLQTIRGLGAAAAGALEELERIAREDRRLPASARSRLDATIGAIRASGDAHCCHSVSEIAHAPEATSPVDGGPDDDVRAAILEDQSGERVTFGEYFAGMPSVVAFFYTRCENPYKCSATVKRLSQLQALLDEHRLTGEVRLAAVTYDPAFDIPRRLERYGLDRGLVFGPNARMLRTVSGFTGLRHHFDLRVNYGPATVNRHQIELYVLDRGGAVAASFTRFEWAPEHVLAAILRTGGIGTATFIGRALR